jgi:hypothetical protein
MHWSKRKIHQVVKATRDVNYQEGQQIQLTAIKQGAPKKVTREVSREIEMLSLMAGVRRSKLQTRSTSTVTAHP